MGNTRKLEEAAATLDDVALTLDEVTEQSRTSDGHALEKARSAISKATDAIEEHIEDEDASH
jgi:hypothetical protein